MMHSSALQVAAVTTFEEMTFSVPVTELDERQAAAEPVASAVVEFSGAGSGRLRLLLCGPLLPELAANMLGTSGPPTLALQKDALGEIANVICGNVLPYVAGTGALFKLSPPRVEFGAADMGVPALALGLGEGRIELRLCFDGP